jgi:hypothetical protein
MSRGVTKSWCYNPDVNGTSEQAKIEGLMREVDRSLLRQNLKLNFEQRAQKHLRALQMAEELRRAGANLKRRSDGR